MTVIYVSVTTRKGNWFNNNSFDMDYGLKQFHMQIEINRMSG